jgi:hypothetical protein
MGLVRYDLCKEEVERKLEEVKRKAEEEEERRRSGATIANQAVYAAIRDGQVLLLRELLALGDSYSESDNDNDIGNMPTLSWNRSTVTESSGLGFDYAMRLLSGHSQHENDPSSSPPRP